MRRLAGLALWVLYLLVLWLPATAHGRPSLRALASAAASNSTTAYGCPKDPVFEDPWVKENVALTYALDLQDGLGGQTARVMGIYAIAAALGLWYVHTPLRCIGHIGGHHHWRNLTCDDLHPADMQKLRRMQKFVTLPSTTQKNVSTWRRDIILKGSWGPLANATKVALQQRQPTLIMIEMVNFFMGHCPDLFFHVPSWRPYKQARTQVNPSSSWLLTGARSPRIVVHMRRGDLRTAEYADVAKRGVSTSFYLNVVKQLVQVLDSLDLDHTVEWFTEPSTTAEEHEDLLRVRREIPNLTVQLDSDLLWNWQQMATADIFVMSKSAYSLVPALVNPNAIIIRAPPTAKCKPACNPSNWFITEDFEGKLSQEVLDEVRRRLGGGPPPSGLVGDR